MTPRFGPTPLPRPALLLALLVGLSACAGRPAEAPFREGLLPLNGTKLYVKRMGAGEPVLVVHGGPVLEHGYLLPHLAPLADDYELILYDQRLSGRSAPVVDSTSVRLATFVDDIEALRRALGYERIHLMGHSWGGLLAMHYALRYGDHLASLVLLNSMSASSALWQAEEEQLARRITAADSLEAASIRGSEAFAMRRPEAVERLLLLSFKTQFYDTTRVAGLHLYVPEDYAERSRRFAPMMVDLMEFDLHADLERIAVPTLLLYGAAEPGAALGGAALHEHLPGSSLVLIEHAGHFPFIEQPEAFLEAVRAFLEAHPLAEG